MKKIQNVKKRYFHIVLWPSIGHVVWCKHDTGRRELVPLQQRWLVMLRRRYSGPHWPDSQSPQSADAPGHLHNYIKVSTYIYHTAIAVSFLSPDVRSFTGLHQIRPPLQPTAYLTWTFKNEMNYTVRAAFILFYFTFMLFQRTQQQHNDRLTAFDPGQPG